MDEIKIKLVSQEHHDQVVDALKDAGYTYPSDQTPWRYPAATTIFGTAAGFILYSGDEYPFESWTEEEEAFLLAGEIVKAKDSPLKPVYGKGSVTFVMDDEHMKKLTATSNAIGGYTPDRLDVPSWPVLPLKTKEQWKRERLEDLVEHLQACIDAETFDSFSETAGEVFDLAVDLFS